MSILNGGPCMCFGQSFYRFSYLREIGSKHMVIWFHTDEGTYRLHTDLWGMDLMGSTFCGSRFISSELIINTK